MAESKHEENASMVFLGTDGPKAPCICFVGMAEHPFDVQASATGLKCNVISVAVPDWNNSLTPWPAPGLGQSSEPFGGLAAETLATILDKALPLAASEHGLEPRAWAIAGYSLAGLFSLYAFAKSDFFQAVASMSGSVWYEGWIEYLESLHISGEGRFAYLSVGTAEKKARQKIMRSVEEKAKRTAEILESDGCEAVFQTGPGTHFDHVPERLAAGLSAIDAYWAEQH